jgi:hypothetical protein
MAVDRNRIYKVRYSVEGWNKPMEGKIKREAMPGVSVAKGSYGYTDTLFLASIIRDDKGEIGSILLLESDRGHPSREVLEAVRDQIEHHLETHTKVDIGL